MKPLVDLRHFNELWVFLNPIFFKFFFGQTFVHLLKCFSCVLADIFHQLSKTKKFDFFCRKNDKTKNKKRWDCLSTGAAVVIWQAGRVAGEGGGGDVNWR